MTLTDSMKTLLICFFAVCLGLVFFCERIEHIQEARVPRRYTSPIDGTTSTLILHNHATTLTVFTEYGKPLIMDIERVRCEKTSIIFQRTEMLK